VWLSGNSFSVGSGVKKEQDFAGQAKKGLENKASLVILCPS
jgi:hypothetical protein